jgi:hypothetical protein
MDYKIYNLKNKS